jgi:hypothetical protein
MGTDGHTAPRIVSEGPFLFGEPLAAAFDLVDEIHQSFPSGHFQQGAGAVELVQAVGGFVEGLDRGLLFSQEAFEEAAGNEFELRVVVFGEQHRQPEGPTERNHRHPLSSVPCLWNEPFLERPIQAVGV